MSDYWAEREAAHAKHVGDLVARLVGIGFSEELAASAAEKYETEVERVMSKNPSTSRSFVDVDVEIAPGIYFSVEEWTG